MNKLVKSFAYLLRMSEKTNILAFLQKKRKIQPQVKKKSVSYQTVNFKALPGRQLMVQNMLLEMEKKQPKTWMKQKC